MQHQKSFKITINSSWENYMNHIHIFLGGSTSKSDHSIIEIANCYLYTFFNERWRILRHIGQKYSL